MSAPPSRGLVELREAVATELRRSTGRAVDPETEIVVTNGAMHALGVCFRSLVRPGDEVVVPAPCFFFEGPIRAAGATPVYVALQPGGRMALGRRRARARDRAADERAAALQSREPHGARPLPGRGRGRACGSRRRTACSSSPTRPTRLRSGMARRSRRPSACCRDVVVVRSLGKSLSMPQLRLGIVSGPAATRRRVRAHARVGLPARRPRGAGGGARRARRAPRVAGRRPRRPRRRPRRRARRRRRDARASGPVPAAAPFLFVHADSGVPVADCLARAGLPVVDGVHFQAPGYARLPFAGAARAEEALVAALARWAAGAPA